MTNKRTLTARERLRIHLREAHQTTRSPLVKAHLNAALEAWNDLSPTPLQECPVCGKLDYLSGYSTTNVEPNDSPRRIH